MHIPFIYELSKLGEPKGLLLYMAHVMRSWHMLQTKEHVIRYTILFILFIVNKYREKNNNNLLNEKNIILDCFLIFYVIIFCRFPVCFPPILYIYMEAHVNHEKATLYAVVRG